MVFRILEIDLVCVVAARTAADARRHGRRRRDGSRLRSAGRRSEEAKSATHRQNFRCVVKFRHVRGKPQGDAAVGGHTRRHVEGLAERRGRERVRACVARRARAGLHRSDTLELDAVEEKPLGEVRALAGKVGHERIVSRERPCDAVRHRHALHGRQREIRRDIATVPRPARDARRIDAERDRVCARLGVALRSRIDVAVRAVDHRHVGRRQELDARCPTEDVKRRGQRWRVAVRIQPERDRLRHGVAERDAPAVAPGDRHFVGDGIAVKTVKKRDIRHPPPCRAIRTR